jgi:hypothetical protein
MNSQQPSTAPEWKAAEDRRATNGYRVFLGWIGLELVGYAVLLLSASDVRPMGCTGFCFSPRGVLLVVGMALGFPVLLGQVIVGMLLTMLANRNQWGSFAAGTVAFFATLLVVGVIGGGYLASTR